MRKPQSDRLSAVQVVKLLRAGPDRHAQPFALQAASFHLAGGRVWSSFTLLRVPMPWDCLSCRKRLCISLGKFKVSDLCRENHESARAPMFSTRSVGHTNKPLQLEQTQASSLRFRPERERKTTYFLHVSRELEVQVTKSAQHGAVPQKPPDVAAGPRCSGGARPYPPTPQKPLDPHVPSGLTPELRSQPIG